VFGLGRGLIDRFFPRMKEDFSNILIVSVQVGGLIFVPCCVIIKVAAQDGGIPRGETNPDKRG
jgi:hypothetical protein